MLNLVNLFTAWFVCVKPEGFLAALKGLEPGSRCPTRPGFFCTGGSTPGQVWEGSSLPQCTSTQGFAGVQSPWEGGRAVEAQLELA